MFDIVRYRQLLTLADNEMKKDYELNGSEPILDIALEMLKELIQKIDEGVVDWDKLELSFSGRAFYEAGLSGTRSGELFYKAHHYWKTKGVEPE